MLFINFRNRNLDIIIVISKKVFYTLIYKLENQCIRFKIIDLF